MLPCQSSLMGRRSFEQIGKETAPFCWAEVKRLVDLRRLRGGTMSLTGKIARAMPAISMPAATEMKTCNLPTLCIHPVKLVLHPNTGC